MKYSPLDQINKRNVTQLKIAWTFDHGEHGDGTQYPTRSAFVYLRVRAKIGSQNWRSDLRQIWSRGMSEAAGVARPTLRISRMRSGQRWREDEMPKCEVIFARTLSADALWTQIPSVYKGKEEKLPKAVAPQPIEFSHKQHATIGARCLFCHVNAEKKERAGLPDADMCKSCHNALENKSTVIEELSRIHREGDTLQWVRVYKVPDFVFFNHASHAKAGVGCEGCHGPVADRDVLAKEVSTGMTTCMNCHAARKVSNDCYFCHVLGF